MKRYFVMVYGRVQGVGFRFFCQSHAKLMDITGYAKNLDDGSVELQIQGREESLLRFLNIIKTGNRFINVKNMSVDEIDVIDEYGFKCLGY